MGSRDLSFFPSGEEPPKSLRALADQVEEDGGVALAAYREPVGKNWQLFAILPLDKVKPTPYQRDISKAHLERVKKVITKLDRSPVVVFRLPNPSKGAGSPPIGPPTAITGARHWRR